MGGSTGPSQPPKKRIVISEEISVTPRYSPTKNMPNFMPEYSEWNPATSSLSASGRSNGSRRVSATPAIRNRTKPRNCGTTNQRCALRFDDRRQVEGAGQQDDAHERQAHENFVAQHLRGGAQASEQRVLVVRGPPRQYHAVDAERRHGQHEQQADIEVADDDARRDRQARRRTSAPSPR